MNLKQKEGWGLADAFHDTTPFSPSMAARTLAAFRPALPMDGLRCGVSAHRRATRPHKVTYEEIHMQLDNFSSQPQYSHAFQDQGVIATDTLRSKVPAVYASGAHERTSARYTFISTERVLDALQAAGFFPVQARQAASRVANPLHARHLIRLRRRVETVSLREAVPEIWFLNSHDGTSAYHLRVGLYRTICTNGLVVSVGTLPEWRIPHRGNVLGEVVRGALELSERFSVLAPAVEQMECKILSQDERLAFATSALKLRYPDDEPGQMSAHELLQPRREADVGNDLWHTLNVIQEGVLQGGLNRRTTKHRRVRSRGVKAINQDLRINTALWDLALRLAA